MAMGIVRTHFPELTSSEENADNDFFDCRFVIISLMTEKWGVILGVVPIATMEIISEKVFGHECWKKLPKHSGSLLRQHA